VAGYDHKTSFIREGIGYDHDDHDEAIEAEGDGVGNETKGSIRTANRSPGGPSENKAEAKR
jgi:hypothetical protein